jgi:DNA-binding PadR family transcriptional regulator
MSLKHAILGFLSAQPLSGYDLKKVFDRSVRHFWPANQSQIYRELSRLMEDDLVTQEVIEREDRLDKKIYHITDAGSKELHRWLSTPLPPQDYRDPALIQIHFGGRMTDEKMIVLLRHEMADLEAAQAQFAEMYAMYQEILSHQEGRTDLFFNVLTLEYGILTNQATLKWVRSMLERLENGDYHPLSFDELTN